MAKHARPLALVILDGWGIDAPGPFNAATLAKTPNLDALFHDCPHTQLDASGAAVGLPAGQMGNSEVGHLTIGAGRVILQDLSRINHAVASGTLAGNPVLSRMFDDLRASGGRLHLMGLLSDGGVHSHIDHLEALIRAAKERGCREVFVHAFMDGRDTPPTSGITYIEKLEDFMKELGCGRIATVSGRFYAMDRDKRWERVERAYHALTLGEGARAASAADGVRAAYEAGQTDEFIEPIVVDPEGVVRSGDAVLFFNFRADRARELTRAFTEKNFTGFALPAPIALSGYFCMTEYDETFDLPVVFPLEIPQNTLGEVVSSAGLVQLRAAETEKYAHVTFFLNGGEEKTFPGEDRLLIESPRDVATYDLKPSMSAPQLTEELLKRIQSGRYDLFVINFANPDMVGHTGVLEAAVEAVQTVDGCVGKIVQALRSVGGSMVLTADHGNCEKMRDEKGKPHTAHTTNPVPLVLMDAERRFSQLRSGGTLADIAPTLLHLLNLEKPSVMTGSSLILS